MIWSLTYYVGVPLLVYYLFVKPFDFWVNQGVLSYRAWDVWTQFFAAIMQKTTITQTVQNLYDDFPGCRYAGGFQFYKPMLIVRDPNLIKQMTVKDFDYFMDRSQFIPEDTDPLWNKNLLVLKGDTWRDMRATLSPSFTSSKMRMMFEVICECANQFTQYFNVQGKTVEVEMKDAFTKFSNDVIATSAFGVKCDSLKNPDNAFYQTGKKITTPTFSNTLKTFAMFMFPRIVKVFGLKLFDTDVRNFFTETIKENIETREREGIVRPDMLHLLMEARKGRLVEEHPAEEIGHSNPLGAGKLFEGKTERRRKEQLTDEDIVAQALIFFFAGFETVATSLSFLSYELATNPYIQKRLQEEIDDTLSNSSKSLTYEALSKMKYLDMVISESLRKWPIALALDRVCVKPYTIEPIGDEENPLVLEKDQTISIPIFGIHRDPQFYPEPDYFNPERFSDENKSNIRPYTYLPFGVGPRNCIGSRFALVEMKVVLFHILSKFNFTVISKTPIPFKFSRNPFQLDAEGGFWVGLEPRKKDL